MNKAFYAALAVMLVWLTNTIGLTLIWLGSNALLNGPNLMGNPEILVNAVEAAGVHLGIATIAATYFAFHRKMPLWWSVMAAGIVSTGVGLGLTAVGLVLGLIGMTPV